MIKNKNLQFERTQNGIVLFISLVILLILSILGLTSMQDSIMQEKMTAAVRDGRVALEGSEATLHFVEKEIIENLATTENFDGTGCLYALNTAPKQDANGSWLPNDTWTSSRSCTALSVNSRSDTNASNGSDGSLAESPRYFIELSGTLNQEDPNDIQIYTYNNNGGSGQVMGFKVVVRSVGSSKNSQRFLSSYYAKRI